MSETPSEPSDHELISRIRRKEEDMEAAKRAFQTFFDRHANYLYQSIRCANERLVGHAVDAEDIFQETFSKVWFKACQAFEKNRANSETSSDASTKAWLGEIANNLIKDELRRSRNVLPIDPGSDNEDLFVAAKSNDKLRAASAIEKLVANALSERDAAIVWFKSNAYNPATGKSEPDREELADFCKQWEITPDTLRQVYVRALKTLAITMTPVPQLNREATHAPTKR